LQISDVGHDECVARFHAILGELKLKTAGRNTLSLARVTLDEQLFELKLDVDGLLDCAENEVVQVVWRGFRAGDPSGRGVDAEREDGSPREIREYEWRSNGSAVNVEEGLGSYAGAVEAF
jgi:hypothetical protein